ncbi:hypothetical protein EZJ19_07525 [Parasulfuritortus cantonensis]|uniref:Uncharacterized protein n=1 Tax=Parasulfuritortus cantonensis TaxID=2528202 RepID=A0A4R1BDW6_9PROT|nr:hypothetical protein [Parasulfuritortus cantonensis]TCJ15279.1 hypothetical protein EZJ19_07525 [Parasulfuritortus cantonensis]
MPRRAGEGLSSHILPTSANLVGACMCAIPLVKLLPRTGWASWIDEVLLVASLLFITSATSSYASIRVARRAERLENAAETLFLAGLGAVFLALLGLALSMA